MRAEIEGWSEDGTIRKTIPTFCPKCGNKLHRTDASRLCGIIFVWCSNQSCRWAMEYQ